jgi:hypothetical protein
MKVVAQVHEVDSPRIAVGQRARVELDAFPGQVLTGEVIATADLAVPRGEDEIKYLEIEVSLEGESGALLPGMSTRVELVLEELPDSVWVPIEAVVRDGDEAWVYTEGLTGWGTVPVTLGAENDTHVVVSGVEAGTRVALVDPTAADEARPAAVVEAPGDEVAE